MQCDWCYITHEVHRDQKNQKFTKTNKTRIDEECNFNKNENKIENEYEKENECEIGTFRRLHNQYDEELFSLVKNILPTARNVLLKLIKTFEGFCIILFFNQILIEENVPNLNSNSYVLENIRVNILTCFINHA